MEPQGHVRLSGTPTTGKIIPTIEDTGQLVATETWNEPRLPRILQIVGLIAG